VREGGVDKTFHSDTSERQNRPRPSSHFYESDGRKDLQAKVGTRAAWAKHLALNWCASTPKAELGPDRSIVQAAVLEQLQQPVGSFAARPPTPRRVSDSMARPALP
jgi:hypothetical protein